jgi:16S rRNA (guanine527-N7)-methyltransferase
MSLEPLGSGWLRLLVAAEERLDAAGVAVTNRQRASLVSYLDEVVGWGRRVDLTAARSAEELVDLTLADASVMARAEAYADDTLDVVDVGTGAGAPGLVLAILRPDFRVTLVEPRDKRVAFLRSVIGRLELSATVVRSRSDRLESDTFDLALSRATLPPLPWLREGARLARAGVWVLLAKEAAPELAGWRATADVPYVWPLTQVARRAVRFAPHGT